MINKLLLGSVLFFSVISFAMGAEPPEGRPVIGTDDLDTWGDMCPKEPILDGVSTKYGHTVVLVDTTSGFGKVQKVLLDNMVLGEEVLWQNPPYDRLSILLLDGKKGQATQNKFIFSKCRPLSGQASSPHKIDRPTYWNPVGPMKVNWTIYKTSLAEKKKMLEVGTQGNFTQLIEQIKELSRAKHLRFDATSNYASRKLIIVSDLQQYSDNIAFDCNKKKCRSWASIKKDKKNQSWIDSMTPKFYTDEKGDSSITPLFDNKPIEVEIIFFNAIVDPKLTKGLKEIWEDYFAEIGITDIHFEYDTSTIL